DDDGADAARPGRDHREGPRVPLFDARARARLGAARVRRHRHAWRLARRGLPDRQRADQLRPRALRVQRVRGARVRRRLRGAPGAMTLAWLVAAFVVAWTGDALAFTVRDMHGVDI